MLNIAGRFDLVVVGSGAGGAAVAYFSIMKRPLRILLLEEGPDPDEKMSINTQIDSFHSLWRNGAFSVSHNGNFQLSFAEGRCLGGSTTINSGIIQSVPTSILKKLAKSGLSCFVEDEYKIHEKDILDVIPNQNYQERDLNNPSGLLFNVLKQAGHNPKDLPRWTSGCQSNNKCSIQCPVNAKPGAHSTFIKPFVSLGGKVLANAKLISYRAGQNGVKLMVNLKGKKTFIECRKLVLATGATQTPEIIARSKNKFISSYSLGVHPTIKINGFMNDVKPSFLSNRLPLVASTDGWPHFRIGGGVVNDQVYSFSTAGLKASDISRKAPANFFSYYAMTFKDSYLKSRYIRPLNSTIRTAVIGKQDIYGLKKGAYFLSNALNEFGVEKFLLATKNGNVAFSNKEELHHFFETSLHDILLSTVHIFGSLEDCQFDAKLGKPFLKDNFGRVLVSDASLISTPLGVNTQLAVIIIGKWVAENFIGD